MTERGLSAPEAAGKHGVSAVSALKWWSRYLADGAGGLLDKSPQVHPDESRDSAEAFLRAAVDYFAGLGAHPARAHGQRHVLPLRPFAGACLELGISQKFTRA